MLPSAEGHRLLRLVVKAGRLPLPGLLPGLGRHLEDHPVGSPHVQHRRGPLHCVLEGVVYGLPRLGHGGVNGVIIGQRCVELPSEEDSGLVGDIELHGHHGRDALVDEGLRHAGEGIIRPLLSGRGASRLAGVEDDQAQGEVIPQQLPQILPPHGAAPSPLVLQNQHPLAIFFLEPPVANVVEDVKLLLAQPVLQGRQRGLGHEVELHEPLILQSLQGLLEAPLLPPRVQGGMIQRTGDHDQETKGRLDQEGFGRVGDLHVADQGGADGESQEFAGLFLVQELPRHIHQLGRLDAQLDPQPLPLAIRQPKAGLIAGADVIFEQGVKEVAPEFSDPLQLLSQSSAGPLPRAEHGQLDDGLDPPQLPRGERPDEPAAGLARR